MPCYHPCIYDSYMVIRRYCDYRDSTISKNHLISFLTHLFHPPSQYSSYIAYLRLIPLSYISLLPRGILRGISLSNPICLSTWKCNCLFNNSINSTGRLRTLGRLFNVTGTVINPYMELTGSSPYQDG